MKLDAQRDGYDCVVKTQKMMIGGEEYILLDCACFVVANHAKVVWIDSLSRVVATCSVKNQSVDIQIIASRNIALTTPDQLRCLSVRSKHKILMMKKCEVYSLEIKSKKLIIHHVVSAQRFSYSGGQLLVAQTGSLDVGFGRLLAKKVISYGHIKLHGQSGKISRWASEEILISSGSISIANFLLVCRNKINVESGAYLSMRALISRGVPRVIVDLSSELLIARSEVEFGVVSVLNSRMSIHNSQMKCASLTVSGQLSLDGGKVYVNHFVDLRAGMDAQNRSRIISRRCSLSGHLKLASHLKLSADEALSIDMSELSQDASSSLDLVAGRLELIGPPDSQVCLTHCKINFRSLLVLGIVRCDKAYLTCVPVQGLDSSVRIIDQFTLSSSTLSSDGMVHSTNGSKLKVLEKGRMTAGTFCADGDVEIEAGGQVKLGSYIQMAGALRVCEGQFEADEQVAILEDASAELMDAETRARALYAAGVVRQSGGVMALKKDLLVADSATVLNDQGTMSAKRADVVGQLGVLGSDTKIGSPQGSMLLDQSFTVVGHAYTAEFGQVVVQGKTTFCADSRVCMCDGYLQTGDLSKYGEFEGDASIIKASGCIESGRHSLSHYGSTVIEAGDITLRGKVKVKRSGKQPTRFKAEQLETTSTCEILGDTLLMDIRDVSHHGQIKLTDTVHSRGRTFYNLGRLSARKTIDIGADGLIWHAGRCSGRNIAFSTSAFVNTLGLTSARGVYRQTALIGLSLGSVTAATMNYSINAFSLNYGLSLPNLPDSIDVFKNPMFWFGVGKTLMSNFVPNVAHNATNLACIGIGAARMIYQTGKVYHRGGWAAIKKRRISDWISQAMPFTSMAMSGVALEHCLHQMKGPSTPMQLHHWSDLAHDVEMVKHVAMPFCGSVTETGVLVCDGGATFGMNQSVNAVVVNNTGADLLVGSYAVSAINTHNSGRVSAEVVTVQADKLRNSGGLRGRHALCMTASTALSNSGSVSADRLSVHAMRMDNAGKLSAQGGLLLEADHLDNMSMGLISARHANVHVAQDLEQNGCMMIESGHVQAETARAEGGSEMRLSHSVLEIKTLKMGGRLHLEDAGVSAAQTVQLEEGSELETEGRNLIQGRQLDIGGRVQVDDGQLGVLSEQGVHIQTAGHVLGEGCFAVTGTEEDVATGSFVNEGTVETNALYVDVSDVDNTGELSAGAVMGIEANHLDNVGHMQSGQLGIEVASVANHGLIDASQALVMNGEILDNDRSGSILAQEGSVVEFDDHISQDGQLSVGFGQVHTEDLTTGDASSTRLQDAIAEVESFEHGGELILDHAAVDAQGDVELAQGSALTTQHGAAVQGQTVSANGHLHVEDETLLLEGETSTELGDSSIAAGHGTLALSAQTGEVSGQIRTHGLMVDIEDFAGAADLLSQHAHYTGVQSENITVKTGRAVCLDQEINRAGRVELVASSIDVQEQAHAGDLTLLAEQNVHIGEDVKINSSGITTVHSASEIRNDGWIDGEQTDVQGHHVVNQSHGGDTGVVSARDTLHVYSETDIENRADERVYRGRFDTEKTWTPALMHGGDGGALIWADGHVINDASVIASSGETLVEGVKGVEGFARTHTRVVSHVHHSSFLNISSSDDVKIRTAIQNALISGKTLLIDSQQAGVRFVGTHVIGQEGGSVTAKRGVEDLAVREVSEDRHQSSTLWGAFYDRGLSHSESDQLELLTGGRGDLHVEATAGGVHSRGVAWLADGKITAVGESVLIEVGKNLHHSEHRHSSLTADVMGVRVLSLHADGKAPSTSPQLHADPTLQRLLAFTSASDGSAAAAALLNLGVSGAEMLNTLSNAYRNGSMVQTLLGRYGVPTGPDLSVHLGINTSSQIRDWETVNDAVIQAGALDINAKHRAVLNGITTHVRGDAKIHAEIFEQKGINCRSTSTYDNAGMGVDLSASTHPSAEVHTSHESAHAQHVSQQTLDVGGRLDMNVDRWDLKGGHTQAGSLSGRVGELAIESTVDRIDAASSSTNLGMRTDIGVSTSVSHAVNISELAGIEAGHVEDFHVSKLHLSSGLFQADELGEQVMIDHVDNRDIGECQDHVQRAVVGRADLLIGAMDGAPLPSSEAVVSMEQRTIETFNLEEGIDRQAGHAQSVVSRNLLDVADQVSGDVIVSDVADVHAIDHEAHHHLRLELPIPTRETWLQLHDNLSWLMAQCSEEALHVHRDGSVDLQGLHFKSLQEAEQFAQHSELMLQFSKIVYDGGEIPLGYAQLGQPLEDPLYGARVVTYINDETHEIVIAIMGTPALGAPGFGAAAWHDDVQGILMDGQPRSYNPELQRYVQEIIAEHPGYSMMATGHSRGAAVATCIARDFGLPAYVYDNPGVRKRDDHPMLGTLFSFQGHENLINGAGNMTGQSYEYGQVIQLPKTRSTTLFEGIKDVGEIVGQSTDQMLASLGVGVRAVGEVGSRIDSHALERIEGGVTQFRQRLFSTSPVRPGEDARSAHFKLGDSAPLNC